MFSETVTSCDCGNEVIVVNAERRLLHWSNIVGTSHSRNYNIWQYGEYASHGVREVCEFGYPRSVQDEIQQNVSSSTSYIDSPHYHKNFLTKKQQVWGTPKNRKRRWPAALRMDGVTDPLKHAPPHKCYHSVICSTSHGAEEPQSWGRHNYEMN